MIWVAKYLSLTIETVRRPKNASGFVVLPRCWAVVWTWAWMVHACRHARYYERLVQHSETRITWAAIILLTVCLTPSR